MIDEYKDTWIVDRYLNNTPMFHTDLLLDYLYGLLQVQKDAGDIARFNREIEATKELLKLFV